MWGSCGVFILQLLDSLRLITELGLWGSWPRVLLWQRTGWGDSCWGVTGCHSGAFSTSDLRC